MAETATVETATVETDAGTGTVTVAGQELPRILPEGGVEAWARGERPSATEPAAEPDPKPADNAGDDGALDIDPRLVKASERLKIPKEDLKALLDTLGKERVEGILRVHADAMDMHSAQLGETGRKKGEEPPPKPPPEAEPSEFFSADLRGQYPDNADLLNAVEQGVMGRMKPMNEALSDLQGLVLREVARRVIAEAGDVAKQVKPNDLLEKAEALMAGHVLTGKDIGFDDGLREALALLTKDKHAAAERERVSRAAQRQAGTVTPRPSGRAPVQPTGPDAEKAESLRKIGKARQKHGLVK